MYVYTYIYIYTYVSNDVYIYTHICIHIQLAAQLIRPAEQIYVWLGTIPCGFVNYVLRSGLGILGEFCRGDLMRLGKFTRL